MTGKVFVTVNTDRAGVESTLEASGRHCGIPKYSSPTPARDSSGFYQHPVPAISNIFAAARQIPQSLWNHSKFLALGSNHCFSCYFHAQEIT